MSMNCLFCLALKPKMSFLSTFFSFLSPVQLAMLIQKIMMLARHWSWNLLCMIRTQQTCALAGRFISRRLVGLVNDLWSMPLGSSSARVPGSDATATKPLRTRCIVDLVKRSRSTRNRYFSSSVMLAHLSSWVSPRGTCRSPRLLLVVGDACKRMNELQTGTKRYLQSTLL
jgi:hypothetical protein